MKGFRIQYLLAGLAVLIGVAAGVPKGPGGSNGGVFMLERLSQTYVPSYYSGGEPRFCLGSGAAEQVAYDGDEMVMYVVGYKVRLAAMR